MILSKPNLAILSLLTTTAFVNAGMLRNLRDRPRVGEDFENPFYEIEGDPTEPQTRAIAPEGLVCDTKPLFDFSCDYGTDFACPSPNVKSFVFATPTCCEPTHQYDYQDIRTCSVRGGYRVASATEFWENGASIPYQYGRINYCCPKDTLIDIINEKCEGTMTLCVENTIKCYKSYCSLYTLFMFSLCDLSLGPVQYEELCGSLHDDPLIPVRLEVVVPPAQQNFYMDIPCMTDSLVVCCPPDDIMPVVEDGACVDKDTGNDTAEGGQRRRHLILKSMLKDDL
jgi:hypothetical protein